MSYYTERSIYFGDLPAYQVNWRKVGKGLEFVARGFYAISRKQPLPQKGLKFDFKREEKLNFKNFSINLRNDGYNPQYYSIGSDVFSCIVTFDE